VTKKSFSKELIGESWSESEELAARRAPLWIRCGARVLGTSLDSQLAGGRGPDVNPLLAARAIHLSSKRLRRSIAESWLDVLIQARQPGTRFDPRVRPVRRRVIDAEFQIRAVADALVAPLTTARGVAMASSLLSDGAGPLYNPGSVANLRSMLFDVLMEINPLTHSS
jgi:hypothetical protein